MHEAGLAAAIAAAAREAGLAGQPIRIVVTGGHDEPSSFDQSLLFHLATALPETDPSLLTVVHEPSDHWCPACAQPFEAVWGQPCPRCGGPGLPVQLEEEVAIEPGEGPGPSDPSFGAGRPSTVASGRGQAEHMEGSVAGTSGLLQRPDDQVT